VSRHILRRTAAAALLALLALAGTAGSAHALQLVQIGDFAAPTYVTAPPGDASRVFVVERGGTIRVVRDGVLRPQPFLDLGAGATTEDGERGLLSLAFAADYATSGRFWIFYTAADGSLRIEEGRRDPADADRALPTRVPTLTLPHRLQANHNGGQLQVGPDGALYVGIGDGGGENDPYDNGQNLTVRDETGASGRHTLLGKILRIVPNTAGGYSIPADNPFAAPAAEVWDMGLRNPYRFSFDRATGAMVIGDVGQDEVEEVDVAPPGIGGATRRATSPVRARPRPASPRRSPCWSSRTPPGSARSSAARWSAIPRCPSSRGGTSSATTAWAASGRRRSTAGRPPRATSGCRRSRRCRPSARTRAAACT
jgi:hypothetical protein